MLNNKSVLITGGTGSFGKKFSKIVLEKYPDIEKIIIYSRDEFKQFLMQNEPEFSKYSHKMRFFLGDVRDKDRLEMALNGVDIVIHAAALKQVPACEYNPFEAIKTNIIGAQNVIESAMKNNVQKVVALSTDKASSPINLYGATKLCSDKLFIAANGYVGKKQSKFSVVRYGNVAGSRGSVIPFFKRLADNNADFLPITHFDMTRFWLELENAVWMVLNAICNMKGGELYVKKIPSMRIVDLARAIAPDIKLKECGIRPGEKLHEQMISKEDSRHTLELDDYFIIEPDAIWWNQNNTNELLSLGAKRVIEGFCYDSGTNKDWLSIEQMRNMILTLDEE